MNWEAPQAVAELSAAFGVLLSLVYVGVQIRQNTASLRDADALAAIRVHFLSRPFVEFLDSQVKACAEPPVLQFRSRWKEATRARRDSEG